MHRHRPAQWPSLLGGTELCLRETQHSWTRQNRLSLTKRGAAPPPADPVGAGTPLSQLRENPQPGKPPLSNFPSTEPLALLTGYKSPDAFAILGLEPHLYPCCNRLNKCQDNFFNSSLSSDSRKERFFSPLNNSPHETTYSVVIMRPKNTVQRKWGVSVWSPGPTASPDSSSHPLCPKLNKGWWPRKVGEASLPLISSGRS